MTSPVVTVSAFQAKTRLSELLRETERGRSFLIRRRGKPVARLLPPAAREPAPAPRQALRTFREIRGRIPGTVKIRALIAVGRRS